MRRRRLGLAVVAAGAALTVSPVSPAVAEPRALVELFTSQGCSSCPAADRLLGELSHDPALVAISLPIDVWDYLGWKDTLANPRNTARWQGYAKSRGDREIYTPQVVVNGAVHALGSDRAAIEAAIGVSRKTPAAMSVPVAAVARDGALEVTLPAEPPSAGARVSLWGLAQAITVQITRGENRGRTITYHNVLRRQLDLGGWTAMSHHWRVPLAKLTGAGVDTAAVLVQAGTEEMPSTVFGATRLPVH